MFVSMLAQLSWLERHPDKVEVQGPTPRASTNTQKYPSGDGAALIRPLPIVRLYPSVPAIATCIEQAKSTNVKPAAKFARLRAKRAPRPCSSGGRASDF